ncbi:MAG: sigma-70 family RNA polymerase sigma factor [Planctomycetota bacterium]
MTELTDGFGCGDLRRHAERVRGLARTVADDAATADDLAQQLALCELQGPGNGRAPRSRGWILGALRNLVRRQHRAEGRRRRRESAVARPEVAPAADIAVQHAETLQRVVAAALGLDEPYRTAILLRYLDDLPVAEVARRTGAPEATVRVRTMRGIEQLRRRLRRELGPEYALCLASFAGRGRGPLPPVPSPPTTIGGTKMMFALAGSLALAATLWMQPEAASPPETVDAVRVATRPAQRPMDPVAAPRAALPGAGAAVAVAGGERIDDPPLRGRVVDRRGRPVAGATVRVFDRPFEGAEGLRDGERTPPPALATTDADGRWSLPALHPFQTWGVEVRAPGFAAARHMQRPDADTTVTLDAAGVLVGTVRAAADWQPLSGVAVRVRDVRLEGDRVFLHRAVRTAADGTYRFDGLRAGAALHVEFAAPGAASTFVAVSLTADGDNCCDLLLGGDGAVQLEVVDADTLQPIADATVTHAGFACDVLGATDAAGRFRIAAPRDAARPQLRDYAARSRVAVHRPGYCATAAWLPPVPDDGVASLQVRLLRGGTVAGVVRAVDGTPVAGARVGWRAAPLRFVDGGGAGPGPDGREAVTDELGAFELRDVVPGDRAVEGELRAWTADGLTAAVGAALPPAGGAVRRVELVLGGGVTVRGRALVNGVATAAYVYVEPLGEVGREVMTRAAADGAFAVHDLAPGSYRVRLVTSGTALVHERTVQVEASMPDLELDLRAEMAAIGGRVLRDDGAPAVGSRVLAFAMPPGAAAAAIETPESFAVELQGPDGGSGFQRIAGSATVGADGRFELALLPDPAARYRLGVYQGGFGVCALAVPQGANSVELVVPRLLPASFELVRADGDAVQRAGVRWRQPAADLAVTLAARRPMATSSGVVDLELPLGAVEVTFTDADTGVERAVSVQVDPVAPSPRVRVEF